MTMRTIVATALLVCLTEKCRAFTIARVISGAIRSSSSSRLSGSNRDFLHEAEYPDDDFTHILGYSDCDHQPSKLQEIAANTLKDVARNKLPIDTDGCAIDRSFYISAREMEQEIQDFDEKYGKPLNLGSRIASTAPKMAIAAEFKRASPSKGDINPGLDAVTQCMEYAKVGAAVISVLTDFKWFKGTLTDMKRVRLATQAELGVNRPAILRKDFILDRYQILEARVHGADTLLLIVAILGVRQLTDLMTYSRSLGMEPLVEVHTDREMEIALAAGAKVIGVNNRNLHTFKLDLDTTERAIGIAAKKGFSWQLGEKGEMPDIMIAALSGITSSDDVALFRKAGVSCVLVGETLMKSSNPKQTIAELLGEVPAEGDASKRVLVKTCGVTSAKDAESALQAGASLIGVIFATKSPRAASIEQAKEIVEATRKYGERSKPISMAAELERLTADRLTPKLWFSRLCEHLQKTTLRRPLVVGVFQGQTVEEINHIVAETGIDIVQLHGEETVRDLEQIHTPCIKVLHITPSSSGSAGADESVERLKAQVEQWSGKAIAILLDSKVPGTAGGGTGAVFDWTIASKLNVPVILAGGLTPDNVLEAAHTPGVVGVDVSSGVEQKGLPGVKDLAVMQRFISNSRK